MKRLILFLVFGTMLFSNPGFAQEGGNILAGAERPDQYLPLLKGKRIGLFANQTTVVGKEHLVDVLRKNNVTISVIFGPEHGFRGTADAGEKVGNYTDKATGIPVVSLYGKKRKPSAEDLKNVDVLVFDIQDVGVRFYTYISSLQEFMETAIEHKKPLLILDRPNPNGHYVDGPVLDTAYRSFVGMQPVPVVYGLTIGEYARMLLYERWIDDRAVSKLSPNDTLPTPGFTFEVSNKWDRTAIKSGEFSLIVIKCLNYSHKSRYTLPVRPSPNLPDMQSVYLYPSTCFFEGTVFSEGRGTPRPFQVFGHPSLPKNLYSFVPAPNEGAKSSKQYGKTCYGWDLGGSVDEVLSKVDNRLQLKWLIEAYRLFPGKDSFFIVPKYSGKMEESFFNKLAGNNILWKQIRDGVSEVDIRKSWQPALDNFKAIRSKYLLYEDF